MLFNLDNHQSNAEESATAKAKRKRRRTRKSLLNKTSSGVAKSEENVMSRQVIIPKPNKKQGINENYARELLELHTLGVDGGYNSSRRGCNGSRLDRLEGQRKVPESH